MTIGSGIHHRVEDGLPFVILSGKAMIEFEDRESLAFVRRGSLCRLQPDASTRWTVSEAIEYVIVTEASLVFKDDVRPGSSRLQAGRWCSLGAGGNSAWL